MATPSDVTRAYRRRVTALRARTYRDLLRIWPAFNPDNPQPWLVGANAIALRDYKAAESFGLEYAELHAASAGASVNLTPAEELPAEQVGTSTRVTSLGAFRKAVDAGKSRDEALRIAYVRSSGAVARLALNGGRSAVMRTAMASPQVAGWRRTGSPQCEWCKVLIGRGAVYRSGDTASFKAHDHCTCSAENVYTGEARLGGVWAPSDRFRTQEQMDANNVRIRAYLKTL